MRNIETPIPLRKLAFQTIKEAILTDQLKPGFLYSEPDYMISALKNVRDLTDWFGAKILIKQKDSSRQIINEHIAIIKMLKKNVNQELLRK